MSPRARGIFAVLLVLAAVGIFAVSRWVAHPPLEGPAPSFAGEWRCWETDETLAMESNPCRLQVTSTGPGGRVHLTCAATDGRWQCWGDGQEGDGTLTFRWTGPKGWRGSTCVKMDPDGRSFSGTFAHDDGQGRMYAKGRRGP